MQRHESFLRLRRSTIVAVVCVLLAVLGFFEVFAVKTGSENKAVWWFPLAILTKRVTDHEGAMLVMAFFEFPTFGVALAVIARRFGNVCALAIVVSSYLLCVFLGFQTLRWKSGRWLNRDPIGESGGANLYAISQNDPVDRVDYFGLIGGWGIGNPIPPPPGWPGAPYVPPPQPDLAKALDCYAKCDADSRERVAKCKGVTLKCAAAGAAVGTGVGALVRRYPGARGVVAGAIAGGTVVGAAGGVVGAWGCLMVAGALEASCNHMCMILYRYP